MDGLGKAAGQQRSSPARSWLRSWQVAQNRGLGAVHGGGQGRFACVRVRLHALADLPAGSAASSGAIVLEIATDLIS
jgi:hypothetical protein